MPAVINGESTVGFFNGTGADLVGPLLVAVQGFDTATRRVKCVKAIANGTNTRADFLMPDGVTAKNTRTGYATRNWILENQNTAGRTIGDPVYLHAATAGSYTFTKPGDGFDVQEVGSVLSVSATVGRILFTLSGAGTEGLSPDAISDAQLTSKPLHDVGQAAVGWVSIGGAVTDGDQVVINGRTYEFEAAANPGAQNAGAVRVGVSGAGGDLANTTANDVTALVAAINADSVSVVNAVDIGGNALALVAKVRGPVGDYTLTNPVDAGGVINISAAALAGGFALRPHSAVLRTYSITAADVTWLGTLLGTNEVPIGSFPSTSAPTLFFVQARTSTGSPQLLDTANFRVLQASTGFWTLLYREPAGGALLAAGYILSFAMLLTD